MFYRTRIRGIVKRKTKSCVNLENKWFCTLRLELFGDERIGEQHIFPYKNVSFGLLGL